MAMNDIVGAAVNEKIPGERSVLIVEDDRSFLQRLAKALESRGFVVATADIGGGRIAAGGSRPRRPSRWSTCGSATATGST